MHAEALSSPRSADRRVYSQIRGSTTLHERHDRKGRVRGLADLSLLLCFLHIIFRLDPRSHCLARLLLAMSHALEQVLAPAAAFPALGDIFSTPGLFKAACHEAASTPLLARLITSSTDGDRTQYSPTSS